MLAPVERCSIEQDSYVTYHSNGNDFSGPIETLSPKVLCIRKMRESRGDTSEFLYPALNENSNEEEVTESFQDVKPKRKKPERNTSTTNRTRHSESPTNAILFINVVAKRIKPSLGSHTTNVLSKENIAPLSK
ncbi:unnamed protein product [Didymodactylos carnosus]|uniref:Uncharacterized protein n=1 Tax=Didymodactylos carnosus TaxID=1234261 RepID=A0A814TXR2_9BILA|nr:unnamed protein product [Didymodactylos carnosus]CAF1167231.1 unnamed protein product [Didymodactylos carnosus]CAF3843500.1 unnamed protein product [Didymodactylos carnosus]CAF3930791.1 unnamed protein product [Didymodactylos carnosus]